MFVRFLLMRKLKGLRKNMYEEYMQEIGVIKGRSKENKKIAVEMYDELLQNLLEMVNE